MAWKRRQWREARWTHAENNGLSTATAESLAATLATHIISHRLRGTPQYVGPLAELIARAVKDSLDRFLLPALAGPLQVLPLSALARKDLTPLALRRAAEKGRLQGVRRSSRWFSTKQWVDAYARSRRQRTPARR